MAVGEREGRSCGWTTSEKNKTIASSEPTILWRLRWANLFFVNIEIIFFNAKIFNIRRMRLQKAKARASQWTLQKIKLCSKKEVLPKCTTGDHPSKKQMWCVQWKQLKVTANKKIYYNFITSLLINDIYNTIIAN